MLTVYIVAGVTIAFLLLLLVPVDVVLGFQSPENPPVIVTVKLLFWLISFDPRRFAERTHPSKGVRRTNRAFLSFGCLREDWERIIDGMKLANHLRRNVRVRSVRAEVRFGMGDPVSTGMAFAMAQPLRFTAWGLTRTDLYVVPDFASQDFRMNVSAIVHIVPIQSGGSLLSFYFPQVGRRRANRD